jgi:hypothetical protein
MLSIQYVYERVLLILILFGLRASRRSLSKRVQKYNFFLNPQAFSKKNFFLFLKPTYPKFQAPFAPFLSVWEGKDTIFFLCETSLFKTFFSVISTPYI